MFFLYKMYKPATTQLTLIHIFKKELILLYWPIYYFDKSIHNNKYITQIIFTWYYNLILYCKAYVTNINRNIYIIFIIIPKILLLISFILDFFYFNKLQIFYNIRFIGFIPLFYTYSIYAMTKYKEFITNYLNKNYYVKMLLKSYTKVLCF
jgi:hypothetical protein